MTRGLSFAGPDEPDAPRYGRARRDHGTTAHLAAVEIGTVTGRQRRDVLDCLVGHPDGLTDEEIQMALVMASSSERPRRVELVESGHVQDSGRTRKTQSGRAAVVWVAKRTEAQGSLWA